MKLVIIGAGKVGETLVENLIGEEHDVVVVDTNHEKVSYIVNRYDVQGVVGSGLDRTVLLNAEVDKADFIITCTSRDEMNILCCVLARKMGAKNTIARVRDPEYFQGMENVREDLGVDFFFNPELQAAVEIAEVVKFPSAKNVENFAGGKVNMVELDIEEGNPLVGKSLMQISKEYGAKVLFGIVNRGDETVIPRGDFVLLAGDSVNVIGVEQEVANFSKKLKIFKPRSKTVFIIGGGKIAYYLADKLIKSGVSVKIVEKNKARAEILSKDLPSATVILGDGTEQEILDEENLKESDACITLTGMDEENVIISFYAQSKGVSKVITKVDRPSVLEMVKKLGLSTVVSPRVCIANHILRFVRAHQAESGGGINTLYKLHDKVEALEFTVDNSFGGKGVPLKNLQLKRNILLGGIVRGDEFILPNGESSMLIGDKVIVVAPARQINELSEILS
ncbi:MAG: Trk system potassium transporter TrkA [Clostridia bacterium]|nr:Trk system potassium transporter TrkA [Clostridia bacterium]